MRTRVGNWLWGLCIVAFGMLWLLSEIKVLEFNPFFTGWWTVFIIVPCLITMIQHGINVFNTIGVCLGVILYLSSNGYVSFIIFIPLAIVIIGLGILFKRPFYEKGGWKAPVNVASADGVKSECAAIFSTQTVRPNGEKYTGGELTAIFGGVEIDLRGAVIDENIYIETTSVFGGVELYAPAHCKVVTRGTHIFGGVTNHRVENLPENAPTIYLESTCIFGGVTIR